MQLTNERAWLPGLVENKDTVKIAISGYKYSNCGAAITIFKTERRISIALGWRRSNFIPSLWLRFYPPDTVGHDPDIR